MERVKHWRDRTAPGGIQVAAHRLDMRDPANIRDRQPREGVEPLPEGVAEAHQTPDDFTGDELAVLALAHARESQRITLADVVDQVGDWHDRESVAKARAVLRRLLGAGHLSSNPNTHADNGNVFRLTTGGRILARALAQQAQPAPQIEGQ